MYVVKCVKIFKEEDFPSVYQVPEYIGLLRKNFSQRRTQGGGYGAQPPSPWISRIYGFQGGYKPPSPMEKKLSPSLEQISEYAPQLNLSFFVPFVLIPF